MIITRTTPTANYHDSYMVEVVAETFKGISETRFTLGPFKRVPHQANLESLLQTLERIKIDGDNESYYWVLGFGQWFDKEITSFEKLDGGYTHSAADFYPREEHEELFALSRGFVQNWPVEPSDDGYMQKLVSYKVYYYDYNGVKYNTEVTL
jgi:hypothetical protein